MQTLLAPAKNNGKQEIQVQVSSSDDKTENVTWWIPANYSFKNAVFQYSSSDLKIFLWIFLDGYHSWAVWYVHRAQCPVTQIPYYIRYVF